MSKYKYGTVIGIKTTTKKDMKDTMDTINSIYGVEIHVIAEMSKMKGRVEKWEVESMSKERKNTPQ